MTRAAVLGHIEELYMALDDCSLRQRGLVAAWPR